MITRIKDTHGDALRTVSYIGDTFVISADDGEVRAVLTFNTTDAGKIAAAVLEAAGYVPNDLGIVASEGDVVDGGNLYSPDLARAIALAYLRAADEADAQADSTSTDDELVERVARGMYEMLAARAATEPVTTWPRTGDGVKEYFRSRARELLKEDDDA